MILLSALCPRDDIPIPEEERQTMCSFAHGSFSKDPSVYTDVNVSLNLSFRVLGAARSCTESRARISLVYGI